MKYYREIGVEKMNTIQKIKESGLEIWQMNDIETWVGFSLDEIREAAKKNIGKDYDEFYDQSPSQIPMDQWRKYKIQEIDEPYQPFYSYDNYVLKMIEEGTVFPCCFASTEY